MEGVTGGARESRAFFAALLAACRGSCECEVCEILRGVADSMSAEFTQKGVKVGRAARKV